jgi:hypothetical protein
MTTIAIAIPHAAHKPGRKESLARLMGTLEQYPADIRVFAEREPHWAWSKRLWRWGLESRVEWLVQLQDDVQVPDGFLLVADAMLSMAPKGAQVIAMTTIHPLARELARMGNRWHRTRAWLMGNAYALSRPFLAEFLPWVEANEQLARVTCEDALVNRYCIERGIDVYHCLPSLGEHDLSVPSTWAEQAASMGLDRPENHGHRKATVSYLDYNPKELARANFWEQQGDVRLLADHLGPRCWFCCGNEPAFISSQESGVHIGPQCFAKVAEVAARNMMIR